MTVCSVTKAWMILVAVLIIFGCPWPYTRDVLEKLAAGWKQSRIEELLPPAWAAGQSAKADAVPLQAALA